MEYAGGTYVVGYDTVTVEEEKVSDGF